MSLIYYVYAYLRKDGTPYYIGKGKDRRAYSKHSEFKIPNDKSRIVFLECRLSNIGACALERRYIKWYGRKDLKTGILHNKTDGGEGTSNLSIKTRQQISIKLKEFNKSVTKHHSKSTKEKIGKAHKGKIVSTSSIEKRKQTILNNGGFNHSIETKIRISESKSGKNNSMYGIKRSEEWKQAHSLRAKNRKRLTCPRCNKEGDASNMKRWHFDNCKQYEKIRY